MSPQDNNPWRIKGSDKHYINGLDYSISEFPSSIKQYNKIEKQNNIHSAMTKNNSFQYIRQKY